MRHSLPALVFVLALSSQAHAATDWTRVDSAMGRTAVVQAGEVHRYGFPRSDSPGGARQDEPRSFGRIIGTTDDLGDWAAFADRACGWVRFGKMKIDAETHQKTRSDKSDGQGLA